MAYTLKELRNQLRAYKVAIHEGRKKPVEFTLKGFYGFTGKNPMYRRVGNKESIGDDLFKDYGDYTVSNMWQGEDRTFCIQVTK